MYILDVNLVHKSYSIYIKKGIIRDIGRKLRKIYKNEKIAVITDSNVEKIYGKNIEDNLKRNGFLIEKIVVKSGEESKSLEVLKYIYDRLLDFEINRGDLILTFGGGVVGDLGGFAASTLLRGIPYVQVPTSLLAQIDSSIGGKVAVNLSRGKNLVGSFYHPEAVFIDPVLLETLEKRFLYDGMAEVIKYGCIRDRKLFKNLLKYNTEKELFDNIEEIIYSCCSIKKEIVENDEKDKGERMLLNFGHTLGHAVEKYFKYEKYTHGEAVAIGMYNITRRSEEQGMTEKGTANLIKEILNKYYLPYKMPDMDKEEIIKTINLDKKNKGSEMNIVLLKKIGESYIKKIKKIDVKKYFY
ncbi:3-dehydroquinate synthase [Caminicella sporogenes DSM 14501]|uniref:3-dehydroquinate synthase n=1 Tax=Caminicella sporogenes DSM 14501 TaxID=1121266 RepID=A0A1M6SLB3_9FIRM|nr:3-dehydroquinate synthase [Caminicella sporogenes]RKD26533.1 3-dehydroquinate synthase [Caminicella sporogenes]SHK45522.1 3-dehydroquinate synthase [Caminicella sporogenes DSM 14501]